MLDGYNVCLFAYGQTGSGKTFTMTGSPTDPGLTPKAITELFRLIEERVHCNCRVTTYFIELYNDNLVDLYWLLDNKKTRNAQVRPSLLLQRPSPPLVYLDLSLPATPPRACCRSRRGWTSRWTPTRWSTCATP